MTTASPAAVNTSRLIDVIAACIASRMPLAAMDRRVVNSAEWRSWKKRISCPSRASNTRRWISATTRLPARASRVSEPKVASPRSVNSSHTVHASARSSLKSPLPTIPLTAGFISQAE